MDAGYLNNFDTLDRDVKEKWNIGEVRLCIKQLLHIWLQKLPEFSAVGVDYKHNAHIICFESVKSMNEFFIFLEICRRPEFEFGKIILAKRELFSTYKS